MKKLLIFLAIAAMLVVSTGVANAACDKEGKIVWMWVSSLTGTAYVYIVPAGALKPVDYIFYQYRFPAGNASTMSALSAALAGGKSVRLIGNKTSCPTTGNIRDGGTLTSWDIYWN
jgi:hypothetical protein